MAQQKIRRLVKIRTVTQLRCRGVTKTYGDINEGIFTPPIKRGRCSLWPEDEIAAINAAEIAGKNKEELKALVKQLVAARTQAAV